ncbi:MAG: UDP-N-acetylmuramoyl-L-alanyl-D-glutamate--2,6-diaminopimelate ligase [Rickettsiaceae bacterium]|nr:UDP-N-acetylmuramoyl-L-alanyl-D-glutamate--2,6-diaminopimelate ligase [Rickettsiaceae bacterium]
MVKYNNNFSLARLLIEEYSITSVTNDSRRITADCGFVAIQGTNYDGNDYLEEASLQGARVLITDSKEAIIKYKDKYNLYFCQDARKLLAEICMVLFPNTPKNMIGLTGTNGKSSVVHYIYETLKSLNLKVASVGTLGIKKSLTLANSSNLIEEEIKSSLTTPDTIELASYINDFALSGIEYYAMEVSSIGLHQKRIWGRKFDVAAFTNFTQDHLDYHGNMQEYLDCKLKLFEENLTDSGIAFVNNKIKEIDYIKNYIINAGKKIITYGSDNADIKYEIISSSIKGQKFKIQYNSQEFEYSTQIIGNFQVENLCLAIAILYHLGVPLDNIQNIVQGVAAPKGRLERVANQGIGSRIFIDYAHTPDALERVLKSLGALKEANSRLICVFGCGGDRDKTKRAIMGQISAKYADITIVTDDNPRREDASSIRAQVIKGCNKNAEEIADREAAIAYAISSMRDRDILIVAGKGHETYQIIGDNKLYFSDLEVALKYCTKAAYAENNCI